MAMRMRGVFSSARFVAFPAQAAQCVAESGPGTAALVELYTSEGCSQLPAGGPLAVEPAASATRPASVVPLALHVDYWDYIGWKDPYAKREFSLRQRKLTQLQRLALVYTPQVVLQGRDFRGWGTTAFDEALARDQCPAGQGHACSSSSCRRGAKGLHGARRRAELARAGPSDDAALYLAAYREPARKPGDAREKTAAASLTHDYVVLEWQGPFAFAGRAGRSGARCRCCPGAARRIPGWSHSCRTGAPGRCCRPFCVPPAKAAIFL